MAGIPHAPGMAPPAAVFVALGLNTFNEKCGIVCVERKNL